MPEQEFAIYNADGLFLSELSTAISRARRCGFQPDHPEKHVPVRGRILIVAFHSPPSIAVGGLRWWGLARHLKRLGWDVDLLTSGSESSVPPVSGVTVLRVAQASTLQDRYRQWRSGSSEGPGVVQGTPAPEVESRTHRKGLMREIFAGFLGFPDEARGWLIRATKRGMERARAFRPDIVITTGPPHSMHVVGGLIASRVGARHVMDYRDPWTDSRAPTSVWDRFQRWQERRLLRDADMSLATTEEHGVRISDSFSGTLPLWVPNGVDADALPSRVEPQPGEGYAVHLGNLYLGRDPSALLDGYDEYVRTARAAAIIPLRFIGTVKEPFRGKLQARMVADSMRDRVSIEPPIPRESALSVLASASLSVVLATRQPEVVPAKLFESVALGVPTLVITEQESASAAAARRVGAMVCEPTDAHMIATCFEQAASGSLKSVQREDALITHQQIAAVLDRQLLELLRSR